jgi:hypothetical protein
MLRPPIDPVTAATPLAAPATLSPEQAAAVRAMHDSQVPLDVLLMAAPATHPPDLAHRSAVAGAVARFAAARGEPDDGPPDLRRLLGCRLVAADLLGRRLDPASGRLLAATGRRFVEMLAPDTRAAVSDTYAAGASGPYRARDGGAERWLVPAYDGAIWGLADILAAVAAPDRALAAVVTGLLAGAGDDVEAYRWVGNWSRYFGQGNEWGESFAWSVRADAGHVVVLGASWVD